MEFWLISRPEVATPPAFAAFSGTVEHLVIEVNFNSIRSRRHVSALCYCIYAVCSEVLSEVAVDLVLGCAGQSDVSLDLSAPNAAFVVLSVLVGGSVYILLDSAALNFLDLLNNIEVDTVRIVDVTVGVRYGNYLAAAAR